MNGLSPLRWPIRWQIAMLLILTQVVAHVVTMTMIDLSTSTTGGGRGALAITAAEPMLTVLRMYEDAEGVGMAGGLARLVAVDARFRLDPQFPAEVVAPNRSVEPVMESAVLNSLPEYWRGRVQMFVDAGAGPSSPFPMADFSMAARLSSGEFLVFEASRDSFVQRVPRTVVLIGLLIMALTLMFLAVWAGNALVAPMGDLARGAERFAGDADSPDLPERGPVEVRRATRAFNRMRQRIRKLINDRSQTLAAIGHDMRTPLTRLRLRIELLDDDGSGKTLMENDVQVLERMIDDALGFLRSENRPLARDMVDIAALTRTVADECVDHGTRQGASIEYHGPQRLVASCDHDLMRRVLENVIGNAAKFAGDALVTVFDRMPRAVVIEVRDSGPGIPVDQRDRVLEPFTRIDGVRTGATHRSEGFGLGLAIARDLMERHGGTLGLSDNQPQGLVVTLTLPWAPGGGPSQNAAS